MSKTASGVQEFIGPGEKFLAILKRASMEYDEDVENLFIFFIKRYREISEGSYHWYLPGENNFVVTIDLELEYDPYRITHTEAIPWNVFFSDYSIHDYVKLCFEQGVKNETE